MLTAELVFQPSVFFGDEFPKCDFHISDETFADPQQYEIFMRACDLASKNGSTYFIFDRDEVTLSACCRLRTTIQETRMLQPEGRAYAAQTWSDAEANAVDAQRGVQFSKRLVYGWLDPRIRFN